MRAHVEFPLASERAKSTLWDLWPMLQAKKLCAVSSWRAFHCLTRRQVLKLQLRADRLRKKGVSELFRSPSAAFSEAK